MQVDSGDGKPWGRGGGRARGVLVAMALIMVGIMMTGCIGDEKYEDQKSVAPQKTPEYIAPTNESKMSSGTDAMIEKYSIEKLVSMSDSIVIGEVANLLPSKWNTPDGQRPVDGSDTPYIIYTDVDIKSREYLKGPLDATIITVRVLGGTLGQDQLEVEDQPSYNVNERVLIFLKNDNDPRTKYIGDKHFVTVGLIQGKISILENNEIIVGDEKMSLDDVRIRITGKGQNNTTSDVRS